MPALRATRRKATQCDGWNFNKKFVYSFFENLYDAAKDRRYGMLFYVTLLGLLGLFAASLIFGEMIGWGNYIKPFLLAAGILILALSWRIVRRARKLKNERSKFTK